MYYIYLLLYYIILESSIVRIPEGITNKFNIIAHEFILLDILNVAPRCKGEFVRTLT